MSASSMIRTKGQTVTITRPTYAAGNTGFNTPTFATQQSDVPAFIQPKSASEPVVIGGKHHTITHVVYIEAGTDVVTKDRLSYVDGTTTRTLRVMGKRIAGEFPSSDHMAHIALDCEETE